MENTGQDKCISEDFALTLTQKFSGWHRTLSQAHNPLMTASFGFNMSKIKPMGNNMWSKTRF